MSANWARRCFFAEEHPATQAEAQEPPAEAAQKQLQDKAG